MVKTITEHIDNCCGCPPELGGCRGTACPNHAHKEERMVYYCDSCGKEVADESCLSRVQNQAEETWVCEDCLKEMLEWKRGGDLT